MNKLKQTLAGAEPLDVAHLAPDLPPLRALTGFTLGGIPLLALTQLVVDALRTNLPFAQPPEGDARPPWWHPMPALYAAGLFKYVGLGTVHWSGTAPGGVAPPHERAGAALARDWLRRIGLPFEVREHAVALILNQRKAQSLVRSGAPDATLLRLACRLHLGALHQLARAEADALAQAGIAPPHRAGRLEAFRNRAERLGVLDSPPAAPLRTKDVARLGFSQPRAAHRAANALRYFWLAAGFGAPDWCRRRLLEEAGQPRGRLNLLIGPAAAGKSSWAAGHLRHGGPHGEGRLVSSDLMRAELTGDPADQSRNFLVFQRCADMIRTCLRRGETVTFDATNYMEELRRMPVQAARWTGAEVHAYFLDVSMTEALRRNGTRPRRVPEKVIERHFHMLTPPALYEADQHWAVDTEGQARLYWPAGPPGARAER